MQLAIFSSARRTAGAAMAAAAGSTREGDLMLNLRRSFDLVALVAAPDQRFCHRCEAQISAIEVIGVQVEIVDHLQNARFTHFAGQTQRRRHDQKYISKRLRCNQARCVLILRGPYLSKLGYVVCRYEIGVDVTESSEVLQDHCDDKVQEDKATDNRVGHEVWDGNGIAAVCRHESGDRNRARVRPLHRT